LKEYVFEFFGTKEDLLNRVNPFGYHASSYSGDTYYYLDDYIVKLVGDEIHFGVARGGHSGGYWFIPQITGFDDRIEFRGSIRYIGPEREKRCTGRKVADGIGLFLLAILIFPVVVVIRGCQAIEWVVRKLFNRPKPKEKTNEERLFDLMENYIGCVGK